MGLVFRDHGRGPGTEPVVHANPPDPLVHLHVAIGAVGRAEADSRVDGIEGPEFVELKLERLGLDRPIARQRVFGAVANHPAAAVMPLDRCRGRNPPGTKLTLMSKRLQAPPAVTYHSHLSPQA